MFVGVSTIPSIPAGTKSPAQGSRSASAPIIVDDLKTPGDKDLKAFSLKLLEIKGQYQAFFTSLDFDSQLKDPLHAVIKELDQAVGFAEDILGFQEGKFTGDESMAIKAQANSRRDLSNSLARFKALSENLITVKTHIKELRDPFVPNIVNTGEEPGKFPEGSLEMTFDPPKQVAGKLVLSGFYCFQGEKRVRVDLDEPKIVESREESNPEDLIQVHSINSSSNTVKVIGLSPVAENIYQINPDESLGLSARLQKTNHERARKIINEFSEVAMEDYLSKFTYIVSSDLDSLMRRLPGAIHENLIELKFGDCSLLSDHLAYHLQGQVPCGVGTGLPVNNEGKVFSEPGHAKFIYLNDQGQAKEFEATGTCKAAYVNLTLRDSDKLILEEIVSKAQANLLEKAKDPELTHQALLIHFREKLEEILKDPYYDQFKASTQEAFPHEPQANTYTSRSLPDNEIIAHVKVTNDYCKEHLEPLYQILIDKLQEQSPGLVAYQNPDFGCGFDHAYYFLPGIRSGNNHSSKDEDIYYRLKERFFALGMITREVAEGKRYSPSNFSSAGDKDHLGVYAQSLIAKKIPHRASPEGYRDFIANLTSVMSDLAQVDLASVPAHQRAPKLMKEYLERVFALKEKDIQNIFSLRAKMPAQKTDFSMGYSVREVIENPLKQLSDIKFYPNAYKDLASGQNVFDSEDKDFHHHHFHPDGLFTSIVFLPLASARKARGSAESMPSKNIYGEDPRFDSLREYRPGDDVRQLSQAASARSGKPVVKTYIYKSPQAKIQGLDLVFNIDHRQVMTRDLFELIAYLAQNSSKYKVKSCQFYLGPYKLGELDSKLFQGLKSPSQVNEILKKIAPIMLSNWFENDSDLGTMFSSFSGVVEGGLPLHDIVTSSLKNGNDLVVFNHGINTMKFLEKPEEGESFVDKVRFNPEKRVLEAAGYDPKQFGFS